MEAYLWNADEITKEITEKIFLLFILSIPLNAGYSIIASYLQAENAFNKPAVAQVFLNIPIIFFVLFFNKSMGIYSIGIGYLFGNLFQIIYLFYYVKEKINFRLSEIVSRFNVKEGLNVSLILIILIEVINQLHLVIDRYFFNFVDEGGIASLNYASVLFVLPIGVFSIALSTAIFPRLAENFNKKDWTRLEKYFNDSLAVLTFVFVPLSFIYFFHGDLLIRVLFQHGEFSSTDTNITFEVLKMYSFSLLFYSAYAVINKLVYSSGLIKQLLVISILLMVIKIILNFILVRTYKQNGLALSSSVTYIILSLSCLFLVQRKMTFRIKYRFANEIFFSLVTALISYFLSNQIISLMHVNMLLEQTFIILTFCSIYVILFYFTRSLPSILQKIK
jgi:putative peptidoglycan lipid II flippase